MNKKTATKNNNKGNDLAKKRKEYIENMKKKGIKMPKKIDIVD